MRGILINKENQWWVFDLQYYIDAYQVLVRTRNIEIPYDKFIQNVLKSLDQNDIRVRCNRVELEYWDDWGGENPYHFIRDFQLRKINGDNSYYEVDFTFHRDTFNGKLKSPEFVTLHSKKNI